MFNNMNNICNDRCQQLYISIYNSAVNSFSECKSGYVSNKGEPCQRCKPGTYGNKCAFICNCKDSNRYFLI